MPKPLQEVISPNVMVGIVREALNQATLIPKQATEKKEKATKSYKRLWRKRKDHKPSLGKTRRKAGGLSSREEKRKKRQ